MPIGQYIIIEKGRLFYPNLNHCYAEIMTLATHETGYNKLILNCLSPRVGTYMAFNPWHATGFTVPWGEGELPPFLNVKGTKTW